MTIPEGYIRVTDVLKPFTPFNNIDPANDFGMHVQKAADRGQRVHAYCDAYASGFFVTEVESDCQPYVDAFKAWFDNAVESVIFTEKRINDEKLKLSGCVDLVCKIKGDADFTLVDIKTPVISSLTWQLQTAAYALLIESSEVLPASFKIERRLCLQLPKNNGTAKIIEFTEHEEDKIRFCHAFNLYKFFNR